MQPKSGGLKYMCCIYVKILFRPIPSFLPFHVTDAGVMGWSGHRGMTSHTENRDESDLSRFLMDRH